MIPAVQNDKSLLEEHKFYQDSNHSLGCLGSLSNIFQLDNLFTLIFLTILLFLIYTFIKLFINIIKRKRSVTKERAIEKLSPV